MSQFRAIDSQHENDVIHGENVLGDFEKLDGVGRSASIQFINHYDQRATFLSIRQGVRHIL